MKLIDFVAGGSSGDCSGMDLDVTGNETSPKHLSGTLANEVHEHLRA